MSFPRYPDYKDSGIDWLGEVPEHWEVVRLKLVCHAFPSNVDKKSYDGQELVRLCNYVDVYYNDEITIDLPFMEATASKEEIVKFSLFSGDTIITKDSETADDIAIAAYVPQELPGVVCGYHLTIVRPLAGIHGRFVKRLFDSHFLKAQFKVVANGLTRVGLSQYAINNSVIPLPPLSEQTTIAAFLDHETGKIDALVSEQEKLIALLKEKRQAVISHAVTKGLDPSVPLKDSGIDWLGEVPEHWEVKKLKHLVRGNDGIQMGPFGGMLLNLETEDTGFRVYGQQNTICGDFSIGNRWISDLRYRDLEKYRLDCGDIVLTRKGSLGNARLVGACISPGIIDSDTIRLRLNNEQASSHYISFLFHQSAYIEEQISRMKRGAILSGINSETIANIVIALPPRGEQDSLNLDIFTRVGAIDTLTAEAQRAIDLLKERRSALISAAVTGKIDLRGFVAPQPQEAAE
jgi:type I restriction enzyme S subunit